MKFLRGLCNILLFIFSTIFICFVQVGAYDIIASQDNFGLDKGGETTVEIISIIPDENKTEFIDSFKFWATDISTGVKTQPKYRIRSWGNEWWAEHTKWADIALDAVIASVKPIFVPVAQANAIKDYYLTENYDINSVYHRPDGTDLATDAELYEAYVLFNQFTYTDSSELVASDKTSSIFDLDYSTLNSDYFVFKEDEYYLNDTKIGSLEDLKEYCSSEYHYIQWLKKHKTVYNIDWKLQKYNNPAYEKFFRKFIHQSSIKDSSGTFTEIRTIKSSVVALYYIQIVSMILGLIFTIKYPVSLLQLKYEGSRKKRKAAKKGE